MRRKFAIGKTTRKIAAVLTASLLVGCVAPASEKGNYVVYAGQSIAQGTLSEVQGDGFTVTFEVSSAWDGNCVVNATLTNTGATAMKNWSLTYEQTGEITQIWSAQIASQNGNLYTIEKLDWNQGIAVGQSTSFGYIVQGEALSLPTEVTYTGEYEGVVENTPTPEPTSTPSPSPSPTATVTPTPEPTSTPTPSPSPTSTPTPSPSPTATVTPTSTPTPSPSPTATVTPTPEPTSTPSPTPTVAPVEETIALTVSAIDNNTVFLSWTFLGEDAATDCVSGSAIQTGTLMTYEVLVDGEVVGVVNSNTFEYVTADSYTEYRYQINGFNDDGDIIGCSNEKAYTCVKKVGGTISEDTVWGEDAGAYEIMETLFVENDKILRIKEGTVLRFAKDTEFIIYGTVLADGTEEKRIAMTAMKNYVMEGEEAEDNWWRGIIVNENGKFEAMFLDIQEIEGTNQDDIVWGDFGIKIYGTAIFSYCSIKGAERNIRRLVAVEEKGNLHLNSCFISGVNCSNVINLNQSSGATKIVDTKIEGGSMGVNVYNSGESSFELIDSEISGTYGFGVAVLRFGMGAFSITGNCFYENKGYALALLLSALETGEELREVSDNSYVGNRYNGLCIGEMVKNNITLPSGDYVVWGFNIQSGASLTIEKGTKLLFRGGANDYVEEGGELIVEGTKEEPVVWDSYDAVYGIESEDDASACRHIEVWGTMIAEYLCLRSRRGLGVSASFGAVVSMKHCKIENMAGVGINVAGSGVFELIDSVIQVGDRCRGRIIISQEGGTAKIREVHIEGGMANGIVVKNSGDASLEVTDSVMDRLIIESFGTGDFLVSRNDFIESEDGTERVYGKDLIVNIGGVDTGDIFYNIRENIYREDKTICIYGYVKDEITVPKGEYKGKRIQVSGVLNIEAGTQINFGYMGVIDVQDGVLNLQGTQVEPIIMKNDDYPDYNIKIKEAGKMTAEYAEINDKLQILGEADLKKCIVRGRTFVEGGALCFCESEIKNIIIKSASDIYINQCRINNGNDDMVISQSNQSDLTISNSTISGGIKIDSLGIGELIIKDNIFLGEGRSFPIYMDLEALHTGTEMRGIKDNVVIGKPFFNGLVLHGAPSVDINIPEGEYFCNYIFVPAGKVLTLSPGARMQFIPGKNLTVNGAVQAIGEADEKIVFTGAMDPLYSDGSEEVSRWSGVKVGTSGQLLAENCVFRNAGDLITAVGMTTLNNCEIAGATGSGVVVNQSDARTELNGCTITGGSKGITVKNSGSGALRVTDTRITGCSEYGLYVETLGGGVFDVSGNVIGECGKQPVYMNLGGLLSGFELGTVSDNTFTGSTAASCMAIGGTVNRDLTIPKGKYVCGDITVASGKTLSIEPGSVLLFGRLNRLNVDGMLSALGTASESIVVTTVEDNKYNGGVYVEEPHWWGIRVSATGEYQARYVISRYASFGAEIYGTANIINSDFIKAGQYGVYADTAQPVTVTYCTFRENAIALNNHRAGVTVNAEHNYWGHIDGPAILEKYEWVGEGEKVMGEVDYEPYEGVATRASIAYAKTKGVHAPTGNYSVHATDLSYPCLDGTMEFVRRYNVQRMDESSVFGFGWSFGYDCDAYASEKYENFFVVQLPDGSEEYFEITDDGYGSASTRNTLVRTEAGEHVLTTPEQTKYFYNGAGQLYEIRNAQGNSVKITLDGKGRPTKITDYAGRETTLTYDEAYNRLSTITDPAGRTVTYEYDVMIGQLIGVTGTDGTKTSYEYSQSGTLYRTLNNEGDVTEEVTFEYENSEYRIATITDANGNTRTYTYEDERRATVITNEDGTTETHYYDECYNIIGMTDGCGDTVNYGYLKDEYGTTKYGELVSERDKLGNLTSYERDERGNITKITYPDTGAESFAYDIKNRCIYHKDQAGVVTRYVYGENGKPVKKIVELSSVSYSETADPALFAVTTYTYYPDDHVSGVKALLATVTTPEGMVTTYTYDAYGNQTAIADNLGNTVIYTYDALGRVTSKRSAEGWETSFRYDAAGNLSKTILQEGETTETVYNAQGLPEKELSAEGAAYVYTYDKAGNMVTSTNPRGYTTTYTYDSYGNVATETLPTGAIYSYEYDAAGRVKTVWVQENVEAEKQRLKEYSYANIGGRLQVTETVYTGTAASYRTICLYDSENRLIQQTNPDNGILKWEYRKDGLLASETDALNQTTYYRYDALKNCTAVWTPCGDGTYTYQGMTYDRDGKLKTRTQGVTAVQHGAVPAEVITLTYTYDAAGRLRSVTDGTGTTTTYTYDKDGRLTREETKISDTQTALTTYTYNHLSEPSSMSVYTEAESFAESVTIDGETGLAVLTTSYEYDADGRLKRETAPDGVVTEYSYDEAGNRIMTTVTGTNGESIAEITRYSVLGDIAYEQDAKGNKTHYTYDSFGNLVKVQDAADGITLYAYDRVGNKTAEVSPNNYVEGADIASMSRLEYTYNYMGKVTSVTGVDCSGGVAKRTRIAYYDYDENGNLLELTDANGNTTVYTYTGAGLVETVLTAETAAAGKAFTTKYTYDALGRVLTEENALGGKLTYTYDGADNVRSVTQTADGVETAVTTYEYDGAGNVLSEKDAGGKVTNYTYNTMGLPLSLYITGIESMDTYAESYRYDLAGRLVSTETSMGAVAKTEYDSFGNITKQSVCNTEGSEYRADKYTYDKNGNVETHTNAEGDTVTYAYDALDRVTSETRTVSGKAQTKEMAYDGNGNVTAEKDIFGNATRYTYDAFDRMTTVVSADGIVLVSYLYDPAGNCKEQKDAVGNVTKYEYNEAGRVRKTTDGEGNVTVQTYDALGNVQTVTDGRNQTTTYEYDGFGRLRSVTTADKNKTSYTYDAAGNLTTQTDGAENVTSYTYNEAGLPLTKTESGTVVATYAYNGDGSVRTMTDANGTVNAYVYNAHGELLSETAVGANGEKSVYTYTYNRLGDLLSMTDESGTTTYEYDELGRVTEKGAPNFASVTYTYDLTDGMEAGYHYELQTDATGTTKTVYDTQNRVVAVMTSTGESSDVAEISYYDNGARERVTYADGSTEEYTFYGNGAVKSVTNKLADGTVIDSFTYVYDEAGNLKEKTETTNGTVRGKTAYTYDGQNRLESVTEPDGTVTSYTYDGAGNRKTETTVKDGVETTNTYTYNGRNQLLAVEQTVGETVVSKTEYSYDANGNQLSETQTVYGEEEVTTTLANEYDLRNQLIRSVTEDAEINNTYNAAGYRVGKSVTKSGKTTETYFLYDGGSVIMEADASGEVTAKNTYGGPLLMRTVFGEEETTYEYLYNAHGDVVTLLSDGAVVATYYYDAFGNILDQTGEADNSILYAGYQYDEETGLYYINARMYDPVTARFLQADTYLGNLNDPLSLNLYTYCLNNPQKYIDPSGHIPLPLIIAALVGFAIGAGGEIYTQVVVEERYELNVKMILFEGAFNAVVAVTGAWGASIGAAAARQAGRLTMRMVVNTVAKEAALGALEGASHSILRQFAEGKNMNQVNMGRVWSETVSGGLSGAFGGIIGVGADVMKQARTAVSGNVAKNARVLDGVDEVGKDTITYRRVQGGIGNQSSQQRIVIDCDGNVYISKKDRNLNLSIDNGEHSKYYVENNRPGADIYEFEVPKWLDDMAQEYTIPQAGYRNNPLNQGGSAPKLTDPTTPGRSIEFPAPWIEWIEEYASNGRIISGGK